MMLVMGLSVRVALRNARSSNDQQERPSSSVDRCRLLLTRGCGGRGRTRTGDCPEPLSHLIIGNNGERGTDIVDRSPSFISWGDCLAGMSQCMKGEGGRGIEGGAMDDHSLGGFCARSTSCRSATATTATMAALEVACSRPSAHPFVCVNGVLWYTGWRTGWLAIYATTLHGRNSVFRTIVFPPIFPFALIS